MEKRKGYLFYKGCHNTFSSDYDNQLYCHVTWSGFVLKKNNKNVYFWKDKKGHYNNEMLQNLKAFNNTPLIEVMHASSFDTFQFAYKMTLQ